MTWFFYSGFVDTLDTFASQAHGAGNPQAVWLWTKRAGIFVLIVNCKSETKAKYVVVVLLIFIFNAQQFFFKEKEKEKKKSAHIFVGIFPLLSQLAS